MRTQEWYESIVSEIRLRGSKIGDPENGEKLVEAVLELNSAVNEIAKRGTPEQRRIIFFGFLASQANRKALYAQLGIPSVRDCIRLHMKTGDFRL